MQHVRLPGGQLQPHDFRRSVEQQAAARHLVVVSVNAVKIAVEQQRQVLRTGLPEFDPVQRRERNDLAGGELRFHMVDLEGQRPALHPDEFIQTPVPAQRRIGMKTAGHRDDSFQAGGNAVIHRAAIFR